MKKLLYDLVNDYIAMHPARKESFCEMILAVISTSSVLQKSMAKCFSSKAKTSSTVRRIQRFIRKQTLNTISLAQLIFSIIVTITNQKEFIIAIDRTNWEYGESHNNILVLGVVYKNTTIPLFFDNLDRAGNSDYEQRTSIIDNLLKIIPAHKIKAVLADREFVGKDWFKYLHKNDINYCIRMKSNMLIQHPNGGYVAASSIFSHLNYGQEMIVETKLKGHIPVRITAKKNKDGELIILASPPNFNINQLKLYKQRWSIEMLFKGLKSSGFNFESTHIHGIERLEKLFAICAVSFAISVLFGQFRHQHVQHIKIKNHGRAAQSIFTYGLDLLKRLLAIPISKYMQRGIGCILKGLELTNAIIIRMSVC